MSLPSWSVNNDLGKTACKTERDSWQCPNMKEVEGDTDMSYEHYLCKLCGKRITLDYDEMR